MLSSQPQISQGSLVGKSTSLLPLGPRNSLNFFSEPADAVETRFDCFGDVSVSASVTVLAFEPMSADAKEEVSVSDDGKVIDEPSFLGEKSDVNLSNLEENDDKVDKVVVPFKKRRPR